MAVVDTPAEFLGVLPSKDGSGASVGVALMFHQSNVLVRLSRTMQSYNGRDKQPVSLSVNVEVD